MQGRCARRVTDAVSEPSQASVDAGTGSEVMTQHLSLKRQVVGRRRQSTRTPVSTDLQGDRIAWVLFRGSMRGRMRNWKVITNKVSIVPPRLPKEGAMPAAFPKLRPCSPDATAARAFLRFSAERGGGWGVGSRRLVAGAKMPFPLAVVPWPPWPGSRTGGRPRERQRRVHSSLVFYSTGD